MLKDTMEKRKSEILQAIGFHYSPSTRLWKLKINSTIIISDKQVDACRDKERFEKLLIASISYNSQVIKALQKRKTLLIKLLKTTVY